MIRDTQKIRVTLFCTSFAAMGYIGIALLAYGPELALVTIINRSATRKPPVAEMSTTLPISQPQAIAALKRLGATVFTDASEASAQHVMVFQESLIGESGYHLFSDADMKYVAALEDLETLHIIETAITDESLACLRKLPHIGELTLRNHNLTDAAVDHICRLINPEYLNICQTQISTSGLDMLRQRFPNCEIKYDVPVARQ